MLAYVHALDPFLFEFPSGWPLGGIRWYGTAYMAGFVVAWLLVKWLARTRRIAITPEAVGDLVVWVIVGVIAGGRLGYVVFYDPSLLIDFSSTFPFWGVLALTRGGMASHGGIIGVLVACVLFARRQGVPRFHLCDVAALTCTPGLFFGRLANFVNAELWGRPLPPARQAAAPWWSVKYPQELHLWTTDRVEDLRAAAGAVEASGRSPHEWLAALDRPDDPAAVAFVTSTIEHLVAVVRAGNEAAVEALRPLLTAYYPSQLIQAFCEGPVLLGVIAIAWWRPRRPGVASGGFLITYGVLRILTEFARQPDPGVGLLRTPWIDFSRGQVLSVAMIVVGLAFVAFALRRNAPPLDGLGVLPSSDP